MSFLGGIAKTVTGIATQATGATGAFRKVLSSNPGALGLILPPQVSVGLKVASALGLKVPSIEQLQGKVNTELDNVFKGLTREVNPILDKIDASVLAGSKKSSEVLSSIDWLL
jgi:hypothetical protein